jgi:ribonuclease HII
LEQETALRIISELPATFVILDGENLFKPIVKTDIRAVNQADQTYLSVAAASILAKHTRDREIERLLEPFTDGFGNVRGGGYANQATLKFVNWYLERTGELPDFYRKSYRWKALKIKNQGA